MERSMIQNVKNETIVAGVKATPAAGGLVLYSITLNEWVAIVTIFYILLQAGLLIPKYIEMFAEQIAKHRPKPRTGSSLEERMKDETTS